MYIYKQNQPVRFKMAVAKDTFIEGEGLIIGVSNTKVCSLGFTYIIKPTTITGDVKIPNEQYPYECFTLAEIFINPMA